MSIILDYIEYVKYNWAIHVGPFRYSTIYVLKRLPIANLKARDSSVLDWLDAISDRPDLSPI